MRFSPLAVMSRLAVSGRLRRVCVRCESGFLRHLVYGVDCFHRSEFDADWVIASHFNIYICTGVCFTAAVNQCGVNPLCDFAYHYLDTLAQPGRPIEKKLLYRVAVEACILDLDGFGITFMLNELWYVSYFKYYFLFYSVFWFPPPYIDYFGIHRAPEGKKQKKKKELYRLLYYSLFEPSGKRTFGT